MFNSSKACVFFLSSAVILFVLGCIYIFNVTSAEVLDRFSSKSTHHALVKQLLYAGCGLGLGVALWRMGWELLVRHSARLMFVANILLVLVFVPHIGQQLNGAHRWLSLFGLSMQPSEFVKYLLPLYALKTLEGITTLRSFFSLIGRLALPLLLIFLEPDNGTVLIIGAALCMLFAIMRIRWTYWVLPLCIACLCGGMAALSMPHVTGRLKVYLDPTYDVHGRGHQPYQARIAAGSGGLLGKGLGESVQKLEYLPEARSDYIAAIYAEEFGFVGIVLLCALYMCIATCGSVIARRCQERRSAIIASLFTFLLCFQAFLHLGVASGLLPSKGTNLPFFSQGGSSLIANMLALVVVLNIGARSAVRDQGAWMKKP